jgi:bisphosphoglycerate-dependent phosphoglycerate mutase
VLNKNEKNAELLSLCTQLAPQGMKDAEECGDLIRDMHSLKFDFGFASALVRTQKTLQLVLEHAGTQYMFGYI